MNLENLTLIGQVEWIPEIAPNPYANPDQRIPEHIPEPSTFGMLAIGLYFAYRVIKRKKLEGSKI